MAYKKMYLENKIAVVERELLMSDGVMLKLFDFIPEVENTEALPIIVFVAGWISHIAGWHEVLKVVSKKNRVLYLETREKKSALLPQDSAVSFGMKRLVQDLYEVVQNEIKPEKKFYFAGSSLGSMIILAYLAEKTIKPEKSLLISPIAQMDYPLWGRIIINYFPPSLYLVIKHVVAWYFKNIKVDKHKEPEQAIKYESTIKGAEPARLKQNAKALAGYSLWPVMCDIDTSVVLIGARTDKVHGIDVLEQICREIPEAEIVLLESNKATHGREAGVLINEFLGH